VLKTTFLHTPLVFDPEIEGHAVGTWRRNLAQKTRIMGLPYGEEITIYWMTFSLLKLGVTKSIDSSSCCCRLSPELFST